MGYNIPETSTFSVRNTQKAAKIAIPKARIPPATSKHVFTPIPVET